METQDLFDFARELMLRREAHAWITVIAVQPPSSSYVGAQAIVQVDGSMRGWIGGGCVQGVARAAALRAIDSGTPQRLRLSNSPQPGDSIDVRPMSCASNGEIELFVQPASIAPLLRIYGQTPIADVAASLAREMGFDVLSIAKSRSVEAGERAPGTDASDLSSINRESYALLATQGDGDEVALESALRTGARGVLLIASRTKAQRLCTAMRQRGVSEDRIARVRAPAGPYIGAVTPEEIALAAIAGLIAMRRGVKGASETTSDVERSSLSARGDGASPKCAAAGYVNPVCGAVIDPARAMSSLTMGGQTHYFCCEGCRTEFERNPEKYLAIAAHMREPGQLAQATQDTPQTTP